MAKAIQTKCGGIQCDAPDCEYVKPDVTYEHLELWLDAPCPLCGSNLLTAEDLASVRFIHKQIELINELFGDIEGDFPRLNIEVEHDGSGIPKFTPKVVKK